MMYFAVVLLVTFDLLTGAHSQQGITSECKSLWGEPERVHRISAVNIQDECTV